MKSNLTKKQLVKELKKIDLKKLRKDIYTYRKEYLKIGNVDEQRKLFLYLIEKEKLKKANKTYLNIAKALNKLAKYIIETEDKKLLKKLGLSKIDLNSLKKRSSNQLMTYARIDSIYNKENYKTLEFNSRRPQMYEDADWFNQLVKSFQLEIRIEENTNEIIKAIIEYYKQNSGKKLPKNVVYVANIYKENPMYILSKFKQLLPNTNFYYFRTSQLSKFYKHLQNDDKKNLVYKGNKIDLIFYQSIGSSKNCIYKANGKINNELIQKAYENRKIEICSPTSTLIFGKKQSFKLLKNTKIQKLINLNKSELSAIDSIPYSRRMKSLTELKNKNLVIKISGFGSGKGVYFSNTLSKTQHQFISSVYNKNKNAVIIQNQVNLEITKIYDLQTHRVEKAAVSLEPFIINKNGKYIVNGYSVRAILQKNIKPNIKFNPVQNRKEVMFGGVIEYNNKKYYKTIDH